MDYKKSYYMLLTGIWSGAIMTFIGGCVATGFGMTMIGNAIVFIGLMRMLGGIAQALIFYKCPNCGKKLNVRGRQPKYCPECGCRLV